MSKIRRFNGRAISYFNAAEALRVIHKEYSNKVRVFRESQPGPQLLQAVVLWKIALFEPTLPARYLERSSCMHLNETEKHVTVT